MPMPRPQHNLLFRSRPSSAADRQIDADLYYAHRPAPISLLTELLDRPLHTFLATSPDSVLVSCARTLMFRNPGAGEHA